MRLALVMSSLLVVGTAFAEPAPPATEQPQAHATCKRKVVGKGLERKVVCEIEQPVIVKTSAKPAVVIVSQDPRSLLGRPKQGNRLDGLSHTLR